MKADEQLKLILDSGLLDFLEADAREAADEVFAACPRATQLLADRARADLREAYKERILPLYMSVVAEDVARRSWEVCPDAVANPAAMDQEVLRRAADALVKAMGTDSGSHYRESLPLLPGYEARKRELFVESQVEMLERVLRYKKEVSDQLLCGRPITRIESLVGMGGGTLRRGRAVAAVRTDAGTFYYKPHDCRIDHMYAQMVGQWFSDVTGAADCVAGNGCGFFTELVSKPLTCEGQLRDYYANFGRLTALFCCIGGIDLHGENVLPIGTRPTAIDLETMLRPALRLRQRLDAACAQDGRPSKTMPSVLMTGVLPRLKPKLGMSSPLFDVVGSEHCLPCVRGVRYSVEGFEADFMRGFEDGYARVLDRREELKELFSAYADGVLRVMFSAKAYHTYLIAQLYRRKSLTSVRERDKVLKKLRLVHDPARYAADEKVVQYETRCLLEGDVPYYCTTIGGTALYGASPGELLHEDYLRDSALRETIMRLDCLSGAERRFQLDVVRLALSSVPLPARDESCMPLPLDPPETAGVLSLISELNEDIERSRIHLTDGCMGWISAPAQMHAEETCGMLSDVTDVGHFLADVLLDNVLPAKRESLLRYSSCCAGTIRKELASLADGHPVCVRDLLELKLGQGLDGVLRGCEAMARAGVPGAAENYCALLGILAHANLLATGDPMQAEGLASLVLSLCRCDVPDGRLLSLVCSGARALVRLADSSSKLEFANEATVGTALAMAAGMLDDANMRSLALAAFDRLRSAYKPAILGWPDNGARVPWMSRRSADAAWIGFCALVARRCGGAEGVPESIDDVLDLAIGSLMSEESLRHGDQLRHGNAMTVTFLTRAARELGDLTYHERAGQVLAGMLRRKETNGAFITSPKGCRSFFDVAYMRGSLGVGACALEWYRTESQVM